MQNVIVLLKVPEEGFVCGVLWDFPLLLKWHISQIYASYNIAFKYIIYHIL